jgi:small subunit ribosomal protein S15
VLTKAKKNQIMDSFKRHDGDTGSTEVQVAMLTERIKTLTSHMAGAKHDFGTQRGLLVLVGQRRKLLHYLSKEDVDRYNKLIKQLGLRK